MPSSEFAIGAGRLHIRQQDLTTVAADAIVNAANTRLAGGGGVDGAIHLAAGSQLLEACQKIIRKQGLLPFGKAVITSGYNLPAKHVIHTVGPIWRGGYNNEPELLASSYRQSLLLAKEHNLAYIAFPAISCGVYGYPPEQAASIALTEASTALQLNDVSRIDFCLHGEPMFLIWQKAAKELFD